VKNKILKVLLALTITINIGGLIYYEHEIEEHKLEISTLQDNVKTKSTKIANLEDVIKVKDEYALEQQTVIDNYNTKVKELENEALKLKEERDKVLAENFKKSQEGSDVEGRTITVEASAYIAKCSEGCTGKTATGVDVSNTIYYNGHRVIAVDPNVIPLNSLVKVETDHESFTAMAIDKGGYIRGNRIDLLVGSTSEARQFGRKDVTLTVLKEGE
jgi:3D (Asp-Asp-Asp) domain-containing protein